MKVKVLSDVHLEFGDFDPGKGDVLILAGDILTACDLERNDFGLQERYLTFLRKCSEGYNRVFYVMGNHEHYHYFFDQTATTLRKNLPDNIVLLDNQSEFYGGAHFVGATMWADFCNEDPVMVKTARGRMNDFELIIKNRREGYLLDPADTLAEHKNSVQWLEQCLPTLRGPVVVVSHHAPSYRSVAPEFLATGTVGAYASDLERIMHIHAPQYWIHGHVHDNNDYMVGDTRVICNPRGYAREAENSTFDPNFTFTV